MFNGIALFPLIPSSHSVIIGRLRFGEVRQTSGPSGRRVGIVGVSMLVLRFSQTSTPLEAGEENNGIPKRQIFMTYPDKSGRKDLH